jgi:hypothetical protein
MLTLLNSHFAAANGNTEIVRALLLHAVHANRMNKHSMVLDIGEGEWDRYGVYWTREAACRVPGLTVFAKKEEEFDASTTATATSNWLSSGSNPFCG